MHRDIPSSITIEDAVARMVNMDYIPSGFPLLEMIDAFREEAEVDYENARIDQLPEDEMIRLEIRMLSCKARHELAQLLLESLQYEVDNPVGSMIIIAEDSSGHHRLTLESVSDWAAKKYGIGISELTRMEATTGESLRRISWEDIIIKIKPDFMIEWSSKGGVPKNVHFKDVDLMGKKAKKINKEGRILYWLNTKVIRHSKLAAGVERKSIYDLRCALHKLTGLSDDPFKPYNQQDGWKARFKLINEEQDLGNPDYFYERHMSFDENRHRRNEEFDFEDPDDEILANHRNYDEPRRNIDYESLRGINLERIRRS